MGKFAHFFFNTPEILYMNVCTCLHFELDIPGFPSESQGISGNSAIFEELYLRAQEELEARKI